MDVSKKKNMFTLSALAIIFIAMEIFFRVMVGAFDVAKPIIGKMRHGTDIVVPIFENGVIIYPNIRGDEGQPKTIGTRAEKAARLFWQGFTLQRLNQGYNKLRAYRASSSRLEGNPYIPYVRKEGVENTYGNYSAKTNRDGFYVFTSPREPHITVFTTGGSTTDSPYPFYLWEYLNRSDPTRGYEVVNGGLAAYTIADNLTSFAFRGISCHPNVIVVYQANNDMYPSCSKDFREDYSHWRTPLDYVLMERYLFFDHMPGLFAQSVIYSILRNYLLRDVIKRFDMGIMGVTTKYSPSFGSDPFNGLDVYERHVKSLIGIAQAHQIKVVLLTQALQPRYGVLRSHEYAKQMNARLRSLPEHFPWIYFYDFEKYLAPRVDELMRRDAVHFDEDGYKILGEYVGARLLNDVFNSK